MPVLWLKMGFGNMLKRRLGNSNLEVEAIGLGGWALGGGSDWGPTDFVEAQQTVSAALDNGVNLIDTAPIYGESEQILGRILLGKRQQVILSTKCGLVKNGSWTDHDLRPETITRQLENSLKNLRTDYIDLYLIHYLDPNVPWQEAWQTLSHLKAQGKVRALGVCNVPPQVLTQMADTGELACVQEELSILHPQKGLASLAVCLQYGVGFMAYGSLCGGILSGKYQKEPNLRRADARNYFYKCYRGESFGRAQQTVGRVQEWASKHQLAPAPVALAWVLAQKGVSCALAGARNAQQVLQNIQAAYITLSAEELCNLTK